MTPKISVITVSYNSESHIEEAIQSVLAQDYSNREYIIIDGASKDRTCEIIDRYKDKIDFVLSEPDKGISDAFNKGIRVASGEIICIVNSDDIMPDNALERFAEQYEPGIDVYRGEEIIRNFETGKEYIMFPTMEYAKIPFTFNVCHMATYIRKDAFERFGYYDVEFKCSMDRELLYRFHRCGAREKRMNGVYGIFRLGGVSQSDQIAERKYREALEVLRRNGGTNIEMLFFALYLRAKKVAKFLVKR